MRKIQLVAIVSTALTVSLSGSAKAQRLGVSPFAIGGYVGASSPLSDFKNEADNGYHAGAFVARTLTPNLKLRVDGTYNDFGTKKITFTNAVLSHKSTMTAGTLDFEYNVGADPSMYSQATILPYISGGVGLYRFSFDDTCTGTSCTDFVLGSYDETDKGINAGIGAIIPLSGFTPFVNAQYHTIFASLDDGNSIHLNLLQLSFGLRF